MVRFICGMAVAALVLAGGCTTGQIERPDGYLEIQTGPQYAQRFLSVDGNVIASRSMENPKGGDLDYWTKAISREMTEVAGYTLKESQPIKAGRVEGTLFDFRTPVGGIDHTYLVAVYVDGSTIALVEAGGQSEKLAPDRDKLIAAIRSLK